MDKNLKTYLFIFLGLGACVLIMQSRSQVTGKSFLGIGSTSEPGTWYEKLGAGAGTFFGGLSKSLWGSSATPSTTTKSGTGPSPMFD